MLNCLMCFFVGDEVDRTRRDEGPNIFFLRGATVPVGHPNCDRGMLTKYIFLSDLQLNLIS